VECGGLGVDNVGEVLYLFEVVGCLVWSEDVPFEAWWFAGVVEGGCDSGACAPAGGWVAGLLVV